MTRSAYLFLVLIAALTLSALTSVLTERTQFVADIEALFPNITKGSLEAVAVNNANRQLSRRIVFLVGHSDKNTARDAHALLTASLSSIEGLTLSAINDPEIKGIMDLHAPAIGALASPSDLKKLKNGEGHALVQRSLEALYMPGSTVNSKFIKQDPLGLYPAFLNHISEKMGSAEIFGKNGKFHIPLTASLSDLSIDTRKSQATLSDISDAVIALKTKMIGLEILYIGAPLYAERIAEISKSEAGKITVIALAGIILLLLVVFRSVQPIIGALITISVGVACGAAATVIIFDTVHLIAVAFGSSLVGVVVDYAIHYYSARRKTENAVKTANRIKAGILLGMGTSLLGFLALAFTSIDILQQIAVYSAFGIAGAAACVLFLIPQPQLHCQGTGFSSPSDKWRKFHYALIGPKWFPLACIFSIGMVVAILMGFPKPMDSVQLLKVSTVNLTKMASLFRDAGGAANTKLLLVKGRSSEEILQREEVIQDIFASKSLSKEAGGVWGVSTLIPSIKQQNTVLLLNNTLLSSIVAKPLMTLIPKEKNAVSVIDLDNDVWKILPSEFRSLRIQNEGTKEEGHLMVVRGLAQIALLDSLVKKLKWVSVIDPAANYSSGLAEMRQKATYTLLGGILMVCLLFFWRFGFMKGARVMIVPGCAAVSAFIVSGLLGIDVTFFTVMACFLVFALGADYALFQMAAEADDKDRAYLAVSFSALSTVFVFGLLSFSAIPVLKIMGTVVVLGVIIAWLIAPLANGRVEGEKSD